MLTTPSQPRSIFAPDEAVRFVALLTGDPGTPMWFTTWSEGGESQLPTQEVYGLVGNVLDQLAEASKAGHGVFVAVNDVRGGARRTENVTGVRALFADEDEKSGRPLMRVEELPPSARPSFIVRSGGGRHFYWLVDDCPLESFRDLQKGVAARLGTDPSVCDLPRLMRLPGFPHLKDRAHPKPVYIEEERGGRFTVRALTSALRLDSAPSGSTPSVTNANEVLVGDRKARARACLATIHAVEGHHGDRETFKACANARNDFDLDDDTAWELVSEWNRTNASPPWSEAELRQKFVNAKLYGTHAPGTALRAGPVLPMAATGAAALRGPRTTDVQPFTDLGNAHRFVEAARGTFLHAPRWGWLHYDGRRWARDAERATHELAGKVARRIYDELAPDATLEQQKVITAHAQRSQQRSRLEAMVSVAASMLPDLKVSPEEFDASPDLLNVWNGTIDLRTGTLRPHSPDDKLTKLALVAFDPRAQAPTWLRFLAEVLPNDETRAFIQRAAGYSATGHDREHAVFFLHGRGRNGKGTLTAAIMSVLGDYADVAPPGLLLASWSERHPTDIMELEGKRFLSAAETGADREWNEERVKWLSGGDALKGRGMHENWRARFRPTHKFWVESNHEPRVQGTDDGIWSRLKKIPFTRQWREATDDAPERAHLPVQDTTLREKLLGERQGILAWVVRGAQLWYEQELGAPAEVRAATAAYRREQDTFADFLASGELAAARQPGQLLALKAAHASYTAFASASGLPPLSIRRLAAELRHRGYKTKHTRSGSVVVDPMDDGVTSEDEGS